MLCRRFEVSFDVSPDRSIKNKKHKLIDLHVSWESYNSERHLTCKHLADGQTSVLVDPGQLVTGAHKTAGQAGVAAATPAGGTERDDTHLDGLAVLDEHQRAAGVAAARALVADAGRAHNVIDDGGGRVGLATHLVGDDLHVGPAQVGLNAAAVRHRTEAGHDGRVADERVADLARVRQAHRVDGGTDGDRRRNAQQGHIVVQVAGIVAVMVDHLVGHLQHTAGAELDRSDAQIVLGVHVDGTMGSGQHPAGGDERTAAHGRLARRRHDPESDLIRELVRLRQVAADNTASGLVGDDIAGLRLPERHGRNGRHLGWGGAEFECQTMCLRVLQCVVSELPKPPCSRPQRPAKRLGPSCWLCYCEASDNHGYGKMRLYTSGSRLINIIATRGMSR